MCNNCFDHGFSFSPFRAAATSATAQVREKIRKSDMLKTKTAAAKSVKREK
jgi:hypothetical protein